MKRILIGLFFGVVLLIGLSVLLIKPVPILPEDELSVVNGEITQIYETSSYDIFFLLDNGSRYYINRGAEQGLEVETLREQLVGQTVTIKYPEVRNIFGGKSQHLSKLEHKEEIIFSELD